VGLTQGGIEYRYDQLRISTCIYKEVPLISNLQLTGTLSAAGCLLCYRPTVFFRHLRLTALSFTQRKNQARFLKKIFISFFFYFLKNLT
jgi:hypothetical protein